MQQGSLKLPTQPAFHPPSASHLPVALVPLPLDLTHQSSEVAVGRGAAGVGDTAIRVQEEGQRAIDACRGLASKGAQVGWVGGWVR